MKEPKEWTEAIDEALNEWLGMQTNIPDYEQAQQLKAIGGGYDETTICGYKMR